MNRHFIYSGHPGIGAEKAFENVGVMEEGPYGEPLPLDARLDLRSHSPSGYDWGYAGSGPAQLSLAILAHHFADRPGDVELVATMNDLERWRHDTRRQGTRGDFDTDAAALCTYQNFKEAVVARWPRNSAWQLTSAEITEWIEHFYPPLIVEARKKLQGAP